MAHVSPPHESTSVSVASVFSFVTMKCSKRNTDTERMVHAQQAGEPMRWLGCWLLWDSADRKLVGLRAMQGVAVLRLVRYAILTDCPNTSKTKPIMDLVFGGKRQKSWIVGQVSD